MQAFGRHHSVVPSELQLNGSRQTDVTDLVRRDARRRACSGAGAGTVQGTVDDEPVGQILANEVDLPVARSSLDSNAGVELDVRGLLIEWVAESGCFVPSAVPSIDRDAAGQCLS